VDEESHDPDVRLLRVHHQMLVYQGVLSKSSLDMQIEGLNMTLNEYYESKRPPDITETVA
jgi:argininosuccinate lyase